MVNQNNSGQFEDAPFNMAMLFYQEISTLRRTKSQAFIHGEMNMYWDCLEELYCMISFRIDEKETKALEKLFGEIPELFNNPSNVNKVKPALRNIDMKLIRIMNKNGMIFPNNKTNGLHDMEKRFNIKK